MKKNYVIDTNILLDDCNCIRILRNGAENKVYIPKTVLLELDHLKRDPAKRHLVSKAVDAILENFDHIEFIDTAGIENNDLKIISEIKTKKIEDPILVTNDKLFRLVSKIKDIETEEYKTNKLDTCDLETYTGFSNPENKILNTFYYSDNNTLYFREKYKDKVINYENRCWGLKPKNVTQNCAMEVLLNENMKIVSLYGDAGAGKSQLSLAAGLELIMKGKQDEKQKKYRKLVVIKPLVEIGVPLGALPGEVDEKTNPYFAYLTYLIKKLHESKPINKQVYNEKSETVKFTDILEVLPVNYIRSMTIDNAIVILDETQNFTRSEMRTILSRMGNDVRVFILSDPNQVDNRFVDKYSCAANWVVKSFISNENFVHLKIEGNQRGVISKMTVDSGL